MKVGDLVKFRSHTVGGTVLSGAIGVVIDVGSTDKVFENRTADVLWAREYTPRGNYRFALLEVVSASR
jgi:hypothetical protein